MITDYIAACPWGRKGAPPADPIAAVEDVAALEVSWGQGISPAAGWPAPAPPESSGSYRASGGGLQGCPPRGVRPRRWRCGCRARTARPIAAPGARRDAL